VCENIKIKVYIIIILPVHFYGCETWSVALGEEHGLGCPKRDKVTGDWRRLRSLMFLILT